MLISLKQKDIILFTIALFCLLIPNNFLFPYTLIVNLGLIINNLFKRNLLSFFSSIIIFFYYPFQSFIWETKAQYYSSETYKIIFTFSLFYLLFIGLLENLIKKKKDLIGNTFIILNKNKAIILSIILFFNFVAQYATGKLRLENYSSYNFFDLLLYFFGSQISIIYYLIIQSKIKNIFKLIITLSLIPFIIFTGSKAFVAIYIFLPILIKFLTAPKLNFKKLFFLVTGFFISIPSMIIISQLIRFKIPLNNFAELYSQIGLKTTLEFLFGRINFSAISSISDNFFGKYPVEVFYPLLSSFLPRAFFPEKVDVNNGMWFGDLVGLSNLDDNVYVAPSIFVDLLMGVNLLIAILILFMFFLFISILIIKTYPIFINDIGLIYIFLISHLVIGIEWNFAFFVSKFIKDFFLMLLLVAIFKNKNIKNQVNSELINL